MTVAPEPIVGDAFGETLRTCWAAGMRRGIAYEVMEREDGFIAVGTDANRYFAPPEKWSALERDALDAVSGRVLDVGCGGGRHAVVLRDRGVEVFGIDTSPAAVAICEERDLAVARRDMGELDPADGTFDTLLMLGNNLGLLSTPAAAPAYLRALAAVARPDARLIGMGVDPAPAAAFPAHGEYQDRNVARGRPRGQTTMRARHDRLATPWFDYWLLGPDELSELVADSPWRLESVRSDGPTYLAVLTRS